MTTPATDTASPAAPATATSATERRPRGPLDARTLDRLQKDEEIILAVADEITNNSSFTAGLASHFLDRDNTIAITSTAVDDLAGQVRAARTTAGTATEGTADFHDVPSRRTPTSKPCLPPSVTFKPAPKANIRRAIRRS